MNVSPEYAARLKSAFASEPTHYRVRGQRISVERETWRRVISALHPGCTLTGRQKRKLRKLRHRQEKQG